MNRISVTGGTVAAAVVALAALAAPPEKPAPVSHATAVLQAAASSKVSGTIHFRRRPGGLHVQGTLQGLPEGAHGFHVHEFGDCSAPDFASAGSHFNPTGAPHGGRTDAKRHVGDMGNIEAGAGGTVMLDYTDTHLSFDGDRSILGRGVIVHEKADDFKTQPTGNAGGRLACGVIGVAKSE